MTSPLPGWIPVAQDSPWNAFHAKWWNATHTDLTKFDTVLDIGQEIGDVTTNLGTNGRIFVRRDYYAYYGRLQLTQRQNTGGRVITGSPGVGKSVFLLYCLVNRLCEGSHTLFYNKRGQLFFFREQGVFQPDTGECEERHLASLTQPSDDSIMFDPLLASLFLSRPWVLIDSPKTPAEPPLMLTDPTNLFPVHASPPDLRYYGAWTKRYDWGKYILSLWEIKEIHQAIPLRPSLKKVSRNKIIQARQKYGPCIRDLMEVLDPATRDAHIAHIREVITKSKPSNALELEALMKSVLEITTDEEAAKEPHVLFALERCQPTMEKFLVGDEGMVGDISRDIFDEIARDVLYTGPDARGAMSRIFAMVGGM